MPALDQTASSTINIRFATLAAVIFSAAAMRILPHPPNFAPIAAMGLFAGAHFARRWAAFAVPLLAMLLSDIVLGLMVYGTAGLWSRPFVYGSFIAIVGLGLLVRRFNRSPLSIGCATLSGSILFFIVTNFGVWLRGTMYPLTFEGLILCYTAAIPFFRHTLLGDACYVIVLFGGFALAQRYVTALREPTAATAP